MPVTQIKTDDATRSRFFSKVSKGEPGGCWHWNAARMQSGYGNFGIDNYVHKAHRVSYALHNGSIPEGLMVLHKCDNPRCVNPEHLYAGTAKQNSQDAVRRGRHSPGKVVGEASHLAKTTDVMVRNMAALHCAGFSEMDLVAMFGFSRSIVSSVIHGRAWKHVKRITAGRRPMWMYMPHRSINKTTRIRKPNE